MRILFLHGTGSKPGDVRASHLIEHGHEVVNPALPDDDFDEAARIAQAEYHQGLPDVVVGSSRGGAVAPVGQSYRRTTGHSPQPLPNPLRFNRPAVANLESADSKLQ